MASDDKKGTNKSEKGKRLSQEQIVYGFNQLRQEQRNIVSKLAELEMDLNEHKLVADALKEVDGDRRCFRMVGGVLVERNVRQVLPAILNNKEQLSKVVDALNQKVTAKGQEINEYREKYNIQVRGEPVSLPSPAKPSEQQQSQTSGVLVENKT
ncbi:prefoldin 2 [Tachypleus tridentatus]|uniref:prefoldin 2 n=1 Tax=Tachypleus tridentatus TaxID=6853 RepID=UPI003FD09461